MSLRSRNRRPLPASARKSVAKALRCAVGRSQHYAASKQPAPIRITAAAVFALRQFLGLTQASYAAQLGVTALAVSFWERATRIPNRRCAAKLIALAQMNNVDLLRLTNPAYYRKATRMRVFADSRKP